MFGFFYYAVIATLVVLKIIGVANVSWLFLILLAVAPVVIVIGLAVLVTIAFPYTR